MTEHLLRTFLAIDIGASSVKVVLTDETGTVLASSLAPTSYVTPDDASDLTREFVPDELWGTIFNLINQTLLSANITGNSAAAIGITSQRHVWASTVSCSPTSPPSAA